MPVGKSICLSSTSVRPVDSTYDKPIDDIDGNNGNEYKKCAGSQYVSLEDIL